MQNLDFSQRVSRTKIQEPLTANVPPKSPIRWPMVLLIIGVISFVLGIIAGLQVGKIRQIENEIVKYPDKTSTEKGTALRENDNHSADSDSSNNASNDTSNENSSTSKFSNTSDEEATFLIKVGTFESGKAESLANHLADLPEFGNVKPFKCKKVGDVGSRTIVFRTRVKGKELQNVFLGCFLEEENAKSTLRTLLTSGIKGTEEARLYDIR